jgi:hypothetical protein
MWHMFFLYIRQGTLVVEVFKTSLPSQYEDVANDFYVNMARHVSG